MSEKEKRKVGKANTEENISLQLSQVSSAHTATRELE